MTYRTGNPGGVTIVREGPGPEDVMGHRSGDELVAVVVNGDQALAERICAALNGATEGFGRWCENETGEKCCGLEVLEEPAREPQCRPAHTPDVRSLPVELLEYAFNLRQYGERAPGGNETWAEFDRRCEAFLRARHVTADAPSGPISSTLPAEQPPLVGRDWVGGPDAAASAYPGQFFWGES